MQASIASAKGAVTLQVEIVEAEKVKGFICHLLKAVLQESLLFFFFSLPIELLEKKYKMIMSLTSL